MNEEMWPTDTQFLRDVLEILLTISCESESSLHKQPQHMFPLSHLKVLVRCLVLHLFVSSSRVRLQSLEILRP